MFDFVLGGTRCRYQGGIDCGADLEQQAALGQEFIDGEQYLLGKFVFFQTMAKPQDGALVRQPGKLLKPGKLAVQGVSKKASSMAGSDKLNHCCIKWMRSMVANEKGVLPVRPSG